MDGSNIMIDFSALQLGDIYEEAKEFLEVWGLIDSMFLLKDIKYYPNRVLFET